jgi:predicted membrane protein (TIGR00267 family)
LYRGRGYKEDEVAILVNRATETPERWLSTLAKEELGLSEENFENPYQAGLLSGSSFALGALIPLFPYFFVHGIPAILASVLISGAAAFLIGLMKSFVTRRSWLRSGLEMVAIGAVAAGITYGVGSLFHVQSI